jgi:hypothetical protein
LLPSASPLPFVIKGIATTPPVPVEAETPVPVLLNQHSRVKRDNPNAPWFPNATYAFVPEKLSADCATETSACTKHASKTNPFSEMILFILCVHKRLSAIPVLPEVIKKVPTGGKPFPVAEIKKAPIAQGF